MDEYCTGKDNEQSALKVAPRRGTLIIKAHDLSSLSCKKVSAQADHTIEKIEKDIDSNKNS